MAAPRNGSNDGADGVEYQATDGAGNVTEGICTVGIDTQPPIYDVYVERDDTSRDVTITFLPADLGSGMTGGQAETQDQVDGGSRGRAPRSCSAPCRRSERWRAHRGLPID